MLHVGCINVVMVVDMGAGTRVLAGMERASFGPEEGYKLLGDKCEDPICFNGTQF